MNRLGERIRKKRELMHLNLQELAEKVGISSSALSQIENSKSFPTLHTLKSIADMLRTTIGELVGENESLSNNPVVLKDDIRFIDRNPSGTIVFLLSNHDINKQMDTYLVRFAKDSDTGALFTGRFGQVFCHIITGTIRFDLNERQYILGQGDNLYFNAKSSFRAVNIHDGISEMLWIQSPPNTQSAKTD
jgi:transcriptional regulator with XRE-family HTH domain